MNSTKHRAYVRPAIMLLVFFALLYAFFATLKTNVEQKVEPVLLVGPGTYIDPTANPIQAGIGVYVISLGNLELTTGSYFMDFYLTILCDRPCQPDPDILNASSSPEIIRQKADTQEDTFHFYRVRANLLTNINLENFPFDEQVLTLTVGDKQATKEQMVFYDAELSGWDYGHFHMLGWLPKQAVNVQVVEDAYPVNLGGNYSRFLFSVTIFKPWLSSFINNIFPVLVIMLVGLLSFLMRPETAGERLALTSSTLVALILFHINLNTSIPPLNSLTYADKFMLVNYLMAAISTAIAALILVFKDSENSAAANKLHGWTRWVIPPLWPLLLFVVTLWQFNDTPIMGWLPG